MPDRGAAAAAAAADVFGLCDLPTEVLELIWRWVPIGSPPFNRRSWLLAKSPRLACHQWLTAMAFRLNPLDFPAYWSLVSRTRVQLARLDLSQPEEALDLPRAILKSDGRFSKLLGPLWRRFQEQDSDAFLAVIAPQDLPHDGYAVTTRLGKELFLKRFKDLRSEDEDDDPVWMSPVADEFAFPVFDQVIRLDASEDRTPALHLLDMPELTALPNWYSRCLLAALEWGNLPVMESILDRKDTLPIDITEHDHNVKGMMMERLPIRCDAPAFFHLLRRRSDLLNVWSLPLQLWTHVAGIADRIATDRIPVPPDVARGFLADHIRYGGRKEPPHVVLHIMTCLGVPDIKVLVEDLQTLMVIEDWDLDVYGAVGELVRLGIPRDLLSECNRERLESGVRYEAKMLRREQGIVSSDEEAEDFCSH
ncbi:hypothetical protein HKX48_000626 [Thoreauomyces humboldtii]|nr:hypothetical protein HKX48_000626 [Thoreauomyces humboldtii]